MYNGKKLIDCHIHYALPIDPEALISIMDESGTDMGALVLVPHRQRLSSAPDALMAKAMYPKRLYLFSGLDTSAYFRQPKTVGKAMAAYCAQMLKAGADGIKLIEGKPNMRKMLPIPDFDAPCWEPFWAWAEKEQVPILWHVNDPEEFWDEEKIPGWAKLRGWAYDDSFINNEVQYSQVLKVLERHPKIKIIFAHFFFMSAQLPRLRKIMDSCPNIMVDLTPGIEMYINFSAHLEEARQFFLDYQDRIVYGTDIGARAVISGSGVDPQDGGSTAIDREESLPRCRIVKSFLSSDAEYVVEADGNFLVGTEDFTLRGLGLPEEVQEKIFAKNFESFVGGAPKPVIPRLARKECRRVKTAVRIMSIFDKSIKPDFTVVDRVRSYFKNK